MQNFPSFKDMLPCAELFFYRGKEVDLLTADSAKRAEEVPNGFIIIAHPALLEEPGNGADFIIYFADKEYQCSIEKAGVDENSFRIYRVTGVIDDRRFWE